MQLTVISDPTTGRLYEIDNVYPDPMEAFHRLRDTHFRPLRPEVSFLRTPDGCTVGENAALLAPGEYIEWNGALTTVG